jgi:hypothetical protein
MHIYMHTTYAHVLHSFICYSCPWSAKLCDTFTTTTLKSDAGRAHCSCTLMHLAIPRMLRVKPRGLNKHK